MTHYLDTNDAIPFSQDSHMDSIVFRATGNCWLKKGLEN